MKYLLLLYSEPAKRPAPGSDDERWFKVSEEMAQAGVLRGGNPLEDVDSASTLRGGTISDGPFAETKETLGGYYIIEVADLDAATEWAKKLPIADYGSVEIRPIIDYEQG